jgi:hypothetical protein
MQRLTAGIIGFAAAPLAPAVLFAMENSLMSPKDILGRLGWIPLIYVPALVITVVLGLPLFLLLRRFELVKWWSALGLGAVVGALVGLLLQSPQFDIVQLLYSTSSGCLGALGFWLIWRQGRDSCKHEPSA